ncbi:c-type cytochrome [Cypionkella psychrotolerans]|uniref:c-type cytochrome n=1 Tax=Cypionkella psychrotolerans TaxID=1678131 RepID=UPI000B0DE73E|nr:cytochrome c [Cypionkella psychrotolerans]
MAGMKFPATIWLVLALATLVGGAYTYIRQSQSSAVQTSGAREPITANVEMVKVKLPARLSDEAMLGKTYFDAVCASCHGESAAGQDGIAPPLVHKIYEPSHHGDAAFVVAVRQGSRQHHWSFGSMPPLEQPLSDTEIKAIIRYVRELQRENGILG